ncbi:hypothetical protein ABRP91_19645 [Pectobacterium brasiliense]|uniref:hypothetical protein n=1 Tax=Pectobacterium brasiliense TaxID=180957 RepID=UPI0032EB3A7D
MNMLRAIKKPTKKHTMRKKYLDHKNGILFYYKGYNLSEIMSFDIAYSVYEKRSVRKSFKKLFTANILTPPSFDEDILFSIGPYGERKDYNEIIKYITSQVGIEKIYRIENKSKFYFSIKGFFLSIKKLYFRKFNFSWKEKLILLFYMNHYINTIDLLNKYPKEWKYNKYCSFCSALPLEAILSNYFKLNGITTYTLQHALYSYTTVPKVDDIIFDNMISDYILCWGEHTKNDFLRYGVNLDKIKICGYPNINKDIYPYIWNEKIRILFLCASPKYEKENIEIMNIMQACSKNKNIDVTVKPHPHLDQGKYKNLSKYYGFNFYSAGTLKEALHSKNFDIAISYNSTTYYDAYMGNIISLKYKNERDEITFNILDDAFSSEEEFLLKLEETKELSNKNQTWDKVKTRLSFVVGYGLNDYKKNLLG